MNSFTFRVPQGGDWRQFSALARTAVPNYLVSHFGLLFGAIFYQYLASQPEAFCLAAYDQAGVLAGCILATLDRQKTRRVPLPLLAKLLAAANIRLFSFTFVGWLLRGLRDRGKDRLAAPQPAAELILFAVAPAFRGGGIALRLVNEMEAFFRGKGLQKPYLILTEKENAEANRFYDKAGAALVRTYRHHGREINEWHKAIG